MENTIWTIGHSNKSIEDFLAILKAFDIQTIADVRRFPGSRKYPHFNSDLLEKELLKHGINYEGYTDLGGRRAPRKDSKNTAWRNDAFRGFADYMETEDFRKAIDRLTQSAQQRRTAIMCSEVLWWRCHRSMISDYLKSIGIRVIHILAPAKSEEHPYTSVAKIKEGRLTYGDAQMRLDL